MRSRDKIDEPTGPSVNSSTQIKSNTSLSTNDTISGQRRNIFDNTPKI